MSAASDGRATTAPTSTEAASRRLEVQSGGLLAGLGLAGALLASSCCVLPLALVVLGVGGAWLSALTALSPYQPYFLAATFVVIGAGFVAAYGGSRRACAADGCGTPVSRRIVRIVLWVGAVIAAASASASLWAPLIA
jgi:mercuric ion transport protein